MCSLSLLVRETGYLLGMNRDEQLTRPPARPPARFADGPTAYVCPHESSGGTWIGLNAQGNAFALLNWYAVSREPGEPPLSRGRLVRHVLPTRCLDAAQSVMEGQALRRVRPFRLVGVFPESRQVREWRWDLERIAVLEHAWTTQGWYSSGHDEPGAQASRGAVLETALNEAGAPSLRWLRCLHRSHTPEPGPYSFCMHRADAATVSYTEIEVGRSSASLSYRPGPPCRQGARITRLCLSLDRALPERQGVDSGPGTAYSIEHLNMR